MPALRNRLKEQINIESHLTQSVGLKLKHTFLIIWLLGSQSIAAQGESSYREQLLQSLHSIEHTVIVHLAGHFESREGLASQELPIIGDGNIDIHMELIPRGIYKVTFEPLRLKWIHGAAPYIIEYKTICVGPKVSTFLMDRKGPEGSPLIDRHTAEIFSELPENYTPRTTFTAATFYAPLILFVDGQSLIEVLRDSSLGKTIKISEAMLDKRRCLLVEYKSSDAESETCYFSFDHNLALLQRNSTSYNSEGAKIIERVITIDDFKQLSPNVYFPSKASLSAESKRQAGQMMEKTTIEYTTVEVSRLTTDTIIPIIPVGWNITDHRITK